MKVRCNRANDSICPLKEKCDHYKIHNHKGNNDCGKAECHLDSGGEKTIDVQCIEIKNGKDT